LDTIQTESGFNARRFPALRGLIYHKTKKHDEEIVVMVGGFARAATQESFLRSIAEEIEKPVIIFDWHGLGMSDGNFSDVTVKRLAIDMKRFIGMLVSRGFFKFHLVGHSLGACVIADIFENSSVDIGKMILLSPALKQNFLLRYWFAKEKGYTFNFGSWHAYNDSGYRRWMRNKGEESNVGALWPYENEFLEYCKISKKVKRISFPINPDYWKTEKSMDYSLSLPFEPMVKEVICGNNILCVHGKDDSAIPVDLIEFGFQKSKIIDCADHYFTGKEKELAEIVTEFIS
jgi:pimeloyl-ACP methyl ester carboxylesterase